MPGERGQMGGAWVSGLCLADWSETG